MLKKISASFLLAFQNIRSNFFHTILSILGIVIGVASLVAILSLIDGLEKFAKNQIATTSSLNAVMIYSENSKWVNGVRVRKDSVAVFNYERFVALQGAITHPANLYIWNSQSGEIALVGDTVSVGSVVRGSGMLIEPGMTAEAGRLFTQDDLTNKAAHALVNSAFVKALKKTDEEVLGRSLVFRHDTLKIVGVIKDDKNKAPHTFFPITRQSEADYHTAPVGIGIEASTFEHVNPIKEEVRKWIDNTYPGHSDDFNVSSNEFRIKQAEQGFLLFRVIMGLIVGISVLVGGIGVMNVLLISVTQRTVEIGVRKAVGANKRDIVLQFLSESITVSALGSFLGLVLGILSTMAIIPLIRIFVEVPFEAEYTWNTFILISVIAVVVGITFGTYPALRASRLDPVEAIRRE